MTTWSLGYNFTKYICIEPMTKKAEKILDIAGQLFLEQGYRSTNMQSIADKCGISKGAIYLHFKSKELLLIALLQRMDDQLFSKLEALEGDNRLTARERFKAQLMCQVDLSAEQKQLSDMFIQDAMNFTEELHRFAGETRRRWQLAQKRAVLEYFGEEVSPWQVDVSLIITGMLNEYASYWLLEDVQLPLDPLIEMTVFSAEHIVQGLLEHKPSAVLNDELMPSNETLEQSAKLRWENKVAKLTHALSAQVENLKKISEKSEWEALVKTQQKLVDEMRAEASDLVLLRALLASLRDYPSLLETRIEIAKLFDVRLI